MDILTIQINCQIFPSKFEWTLILLKVIYESKAPSCKRYLQKYLLCRGRYFTSYGPQNLGRSRT